MQALVTIYAWSTIHPGLMLHFVLNLHGEVCNVKILKMIRNVFKFIGFACTGSKTRILSFIWGGGHSLIERTGMLIGNVKRNP